MTLAFRSGLCKNDSTSVGALTSNAGSSKSILSVIVSAGCCILFSFFIMKSFTFICTLSEQILARFQWKCQRIRRQHYMSEPLLLCFAKHHYRGNKLSKGIISQKYLLQLFVYTESNALDKYTSVTLSVFCTSSFDDSTDSQNLWICRSISPKGFLIIPKTFLIFGFDTK